MDGIDRAAYHEGEWQWEEDGYTVTRTYNYSAPGCHDSCGILAYTKDNRLVKVEGDPLDPCTNGKLCMRCLNLPEATNYPDRLKYPMRNAHAKTAATWTRSSASRGTRRWTSSRAGSRPTSTTPAWAASPSW